jgi:hypothetical protein
VNALLVIFRRLLSPLNGLPSPETTDGEITRRKMKIRVVEIG